jgi:hypothetical protein
MHFIDRYKYIESLLLSVYDTNDANTIKLLSTYCVETELKAMEYFDIFVYIVIYLYDV